MIRSDFNDFRYDGGDGGHYESYFQRANHPSRKLAFWIRYTLLLLPERLYEAPFPKAKALVGSPMARFDGQLVVDGERVPVDGWVGSQNHNWGSKHTDEYAWGQVEARPPCGLANTQRTRSPRAP